MAWGHGAAGRVGSSKTVAGARVMGQGRDVHQDNPPGVTLTFECCHCCQEISYLSGTQNRSMTT